MPLSMISRTTHIPVLVQVEQVRVYAWVEDPGR